MSSITAQQIKLDLKLVPKEKRFEIVKCNRRLTHGMKPREPTFQVLLDAIALTPCYPAFLITVDIPERYLQDLPRVQGQDFDALLTDEVTVIFLRELGHTGKLSHSMMLLLIRCINLRELLLLSSTEVYLERLLVLISFISLEHKSFGKKVSARKTTRKQASRVVIRDTPVESSDKRKEKVDVSRGKGIKLLFEVALTEEAQMKEVRRKSLREFYRTYPSSSGTFAEKPPSIEKMKSTVINSENESDSESNHQEDEEELEDDKEENKDEFVKTPSNTDVEDESKIDDKDEGNENLEITQKQVVEDTQVTILIVVKETEVLVTSSSRSSDLASKFLNFTDIPPNNAEIVSPLDVHVHHEVSSTHAPTLLIVVSTLEKDVDELKKDDPLKAQVTALVDEHLDTRLKATREEFISQLSSSIIATHAKQVKIQLPYLLPKESTYEADATLTEFELKNILIDKIDKSKSYLAAPKHRECYDGLIKSYNFNKDFFSTYEVYLLKRSRDDKDKDEGPSARSNRGLKKWKTNKDVKPTKGPKAKESKSSSSKGTKYQNLLESLFNQMNQSLKLQIQICHKIKKGIWLMMMINLGERLNINMTGPAFRLLKGTRSNFAELEYDFKECYKDLSEKLDWENPEGVDYPFNLTKPLPLVMNGNRQMVPIDYLFNNDLKYLQGGVSTMTYTTPLTKTKATRYDLPGIKDMVPNIWSPVKVAYDKHAL
ncbi:hypothetical protein Tco_0899719 [Tanacetum coccineum]